ncbi:hypothetical protein ACFWY6_24230 [Streptomyces sp. NPDC059037]|uniref:hypothetical protein n=1 Tax=Streptomyces sp. NPDC059037 TaxID=3346710 RepID=UPI0036ABF85C
MSFSKASSSVRSVREATLRTFASPFAQRAAPDGVLCDAVRDLGNTVIGWMEYVRDNAGTFLGSCTIGGAVGE